jgi:hypothetical protein
LTAGTGLSDLAVDEMPRQVVVNQTFVDQYLEGREAIGRQVRLLPLAEPADPVRHRVFEIAGVVADVKNQGLQRTADPEIYIPWSSASRGALLFVLRGANEPSLLMKAVRQSSHCQRMLERRFYWPGISIRSTRPLAQPIASRPSVSNASRSRRVPSPWITVSCVPELESRTSTVPVTRPTATDR